MLGPAVSVDRIVAGIEIQPNTTLAAAAGIAVKNGIIVDGTLQTNLPGIYAAGDVAELQLPGEEKSIRVEHEDNANAMGKQAGRNMARRPGAIPTPILLLLRSVRSGV